MAQDRQFLVEALDAQGNAVARVVVSGLNIVGSRITSATAGAAASLVTWAGNGQSATVAAAVTPPAVRVVDANGLGVAGSTVTFVLGTGTSASASGMTQTTDTNGVATVGAWSVGTTAGQANTLQVFSGALTNSPLGFSITPTAGSAFSAAVSAGNSQSSTPASLLPSRLTVLVHDRYGNVVSGQAVTWTSSSPDATFGTNPGSTNASGLAGTTYTTGQSASTESVWAAISSATSARFGIGVVAATPSEVQIIGGDAQTALSGSTLPTNPTVLVTDLYNNPVSTVTVDFVLVAGSGNISRTSAAPGSNGTTDVQWQLGSTAGLNALEVSLRGVSNSTATFTASGTNPAADTIAIQSGNNQSGTVAAALSLPLAVLTSGAGSAASGQVVAFSVTSGSLSTSAPVSSTSGIARTVWTMPNGAGSYTCTASAGTLSGSPLTFTATATAGTVTKLVVSTQPSSSPQPGVAFPQQPVVVSTDQYGNPVSTNTRVGAVLASGDGVLASAVSTYAVASGATATFSGLSYTYASNLNFQLEFEARSLSTATATQQVSQPPFANKLAFLTQPASTTTAGTLGNVQVEVQDGLGARVTSATNAITVALTDSANTEGGTLGGTLSANASSGIATFGNLSVNTAGSFTLDATATGLTGATSASFSITSTQHPNEPSGMSALHTTRFLNFTSTSPSVNGAANEGLTRSTNGNGATVLDTVAPYSGVSVLRIKNPNGSVQGSGYDHIRPGTGSSYIYQGAQFTKLYMHFKVRVDSNYRMPAGSGVQKLFHVQSLCDAVGTGEGGSLVVPSIVGAVDSTTGSCNLQLRFQNMSTVNGVATSFNGNSTAAPRGTWYDVEVYLEQNTGSSANGIAKMWVNGVLKSSYTTLTYRNGGTKEFTNIRLNPTYGGSGTINGDQYVYFADWYSSGGS